MKTFSFSDKHTTTIVLDRVNSIEQYDRDRVYRIIITYAFHGDGSVATIYFDDKEKRDLNFLMLLRALESVDPQ